MHIMFCRHNLKVLSVEICFCCNLGFSIWPSQNPVPASSWCWVFNRTMGFVCIYVDCGTDACWFLICKLVDIFYKPIFLFVCNPSQYSFRHWRNQVYLRRERLPTVLLILQHRVISENIVCIGKPHHESRMYCLEGYLSYLSRSTLEYGVKKSK